MTDFVITPVRGLQMTAQRIAHVFAKWPKRFFAPASVRRSAYPAAWELAGITRIDRFDIVPWLSF